MGATRRENTRYCNFYNNTLDIVFLLYSIRYCNFHNISWPSILLCGLQSTKTSDQILHFSQSHLGYCASTIFIQILPFSQYNIRYCPKKYKIHSYAGNFTNVQSDITSFRFSQQIFHLSIAIYKFFEKISDNVFLQYSISPI